MNKTTRVISTKASLFIVPNKASLAEKTMNPLTRIEKQIEIAELNGSVYDKYSDHLINVWIHADDVIKSDNITDHGISVIIDDKKYRIRCDCRFLSEHILRGHKEGDVINLKLPAYIVDAEYDDEDEEDDEMREEIILDMQVGLNQLDFRYKSFGPIEEVLEYVTK